VIWRKTRNCWKLFGARSTVLQPCDKDARLEAEWYLRGVFQATRKCHEIDKKSISTVHGNDKEQGGMQTRILESLRSGYAQTVVKTKGMKKEVTFDLLITGIKLETRAE
jgi:hypothetical protein